MQTIEIIKIGGNVVNDYKVLNQFLIDFSNIKSLKILVHGGGNLATEIAEKLLIKQTIIDGRRITDAQTLDIATMVYGGKINKNIVAQLQAIGTNAVGFSGADGNLISGHKRKVATIDYGFVGDVDSVNTDFFKLLLAGGFTPVVCPIIHDNNGQLLNTNADTIASELAVFLSPFFSVKLTYCFEKFGVLMDISDENSYIEDLDLKLYEILKSKKLIANGMIPKLENAFSALAKGVQNIAICHAENIKIQKNFIGTTITL